MPGGSGGGLCFHEDTLIEYEGETLSLRNPGPCRIPHVLEGMRGGVVLETESGELLRLTANHLVFAHRLGLVPARLLVAGRDAVMVGREERPVLLKNVQLDDTPARYFGLNCPQGSVVLANNIKCSTFDTLHHLPALWMRVASAVVGIDRASRWGDTMAGWAHSLGIV